MKKVLLTGASGFIGRHCIQPLRHLGYEVHCVSTSRIDEQQEGVVWHKANLLEPEQISTLVSKVKADALLHLAWFVEPSQVINHLCNIEWVERSIQLIREFHQNGGTRATLTGSCYEYDWNYGYCSEQFTPRQSDTVYGTAKNSLFDLFQSYCSQSDLSGSWGRLFFLYGPYENPRRLVSSVILSMLNGKSAKSSHGLQIRDYMHVQDAANGLVRLLDSKISGDVNIASGQATTIKQILQELANLMQAEELLALGALPARANDTPLVVADVQKIKEQLNWEPEFDLRSGLQDTIQWWKDNREFTR